MQDFVEVPTEAKSVRRTENPAVLQLRGLGQFACVADQPDGQPLTRRGAGDDAGGPCPVRPVASNTGEQFLYVIRGESAPTLDGRTFTLKKGDTAHYEANVTHAWRNVSGSSGSGRRGCVLTRTGGEQTGPAGGSGRQQATAGRCYGPRIGRRHREGREVSTIRSRSRQLSLR